MDKGRLWDDNLKHLGYPSKFYRVQDASSGNDSTFWCHFVVILMINPQNTWFFTKVTFKKTTKKNPARKPANSRPSGDASQIVAF